MQSHRRQLQAHVLPMVLFLALLALCQFLTVRGQTFLLRHAEFWIYPAQTILCAALLIWFRRCYQFHRPKSVALTLLIGLAVFGIWTAPQYFLHFAPRPVGFDPTLLESNSAIYWSMILFVSFVLLSSFRWRKKFSGAVFCFALLSTNISSEFHLANLTGSLAVVTVA